MKNKILKYVIFDLLRSKLIISYTLTLLLISFGIIYLGGGASKIIASLLNIVLFIVPLVSIIFGTIHYYNSKEFIEFLLTQPVNRKSIYYAEYFGLSISLSLGYIMGIGLPILLTEFSIAAIYLLIAGTFLTFVFTALALLSSVFNKDKIKGVGVSILIWLYLALIFDGIVLIIAYSFSSYPLEKLLIALTALNPLDLGRILILLELDVSALMGFTGATFQKFFGEALGKIFSFSFLLLWIVIPYYLALRKFRKKNF